MPPTLAQYNCFHSMLCVPPTAKACCESFDGQIVFMPANTTASQSDSTDKLSIATYYLLCALSGTTLSTQRGLTDIVDCREVEGKEQTVVMKDGQLSPLLTSMRQNNIYVSLEALQYVAKKDNVDDISQFRIVRRFEYDFRLLGLNVIMIHLQSKTNGPLHLVEVYDFRRPLVRQFCSVVVALFEFIWPFLDTMLRIGGMGKKKNSKID